VAESVALPKLQKSFIEQVTRRYLLNLPCRSHYIFNVIRNNFGLAFLKHWRELLLCEFIGPGLNVVTLTTIRQTCKSSFFWQEYLANSNIFD